MWRHKVFRSCNLSIATKVQVCPIAGGVSPSVWCRDLPYETTELKEAKDIPDEVFKGYFRVHSAGQEEE